MFYDMQKRQEGLAAYNDFVTLDEVQTISFKDTDEMRATIRQQLALLDDEYSGKKIPNFEVI